MMSTTDDGTHPILPPTPPRSPHLDPNKVDAGAVMRSQSEYCQYHSRFPPTSKPSLRRLENHHPDASRGLDFEKTSRGEKKTLALRTKELGGGRRRTAELGPGSSSWAHSPLQIQERDVVVPLTPTSTVSGGDTAREEGEEDEIDGSEPSTLGPSRFDLKMGFDGDGMVNGDSDLYGVPRGARVLEFIGEGSANVVVRIELPEDVAPETRKFFQGKLLRLQKASENPEKKPYPYPIQYQYWKDCVKPLFAEKDDLVSHDLVYLGAGHHVIDDVERLLAMMDHVSRDGSEGGIPRGLKGSISDLEGSEIKRRKKQFLGSRLARVEHAILVEDMRVDERDGVLIEIKPKWLLQSPSAPSNAVRCRNCAIQLHRRRKDPSLSNKKHPCPLLLTSEHWQRRALYMSTLFREDELGSWYVEPLRKWFRGNTGSRPKRLLTHLRNLQDRLDRKGPLGAEPDDEDFQLAMTLRDCSVFLRVLRPRPGESLPKVVAKLADLDKKNAGAKMSYWKRTEEELVQGGAYTGGYRVDFCAMMAVPVRTGCVLEESVFALMPAQAVPIRCREEEDDRLVGRERIDELGAGG